MRYLVKVVRVAEMVAEVYVEASSEAEAQDSAVDYVNSGEDVYWSDEETIDIRAAEAAEH